MEERKKTEADFHDQRSRDKESDNQAEFEKKYPNKKLYCITKEHRKRIDSWIQSNSGKSKIALDYCCGEGEGAIKLAKAGAITFGIDISGDSLKLAEIDSKDLTNKPTFKIMDAENLDFEDDYFDIIYAAGCFHHLDLDKTYSELHRVLKPNGRIMCNEALAHNPIFHYYRKKTPHLRTPWEVPHILKVEDVYKANKYFEKVDVKYHYLISLMAVPFKNTFIFNPLLKFLAFIDRIILSVPIINKYAWQCTYELSYPKKINA
jgi:ubiquinone/menaquinone biosynthesis C-methylase UbiE